MLPFVWWRESPVAGYKIIGNDGDEPFPWGVDDSAAHDPRRIAAESHGHSQRLLAAGPGLLEGVIQNKGHPGQIAEILQ